MKVLSTAKKTESFLFLLVILIPRAHQQEVTFSKVSSVHFPLHHCITTNVKLRGKLKCQRDDVFAGVRLRLDGSY